MSSVDSSFFHAEATLPADLPCYVERRADAELLKALNAGKFTVILSSRKVGKSSLMERAFASLRREGTFVVKKELAEADAGITVESWYAGLVEEIVNDARRRNGFQVDPGWRDWWASRSNIPSGQRFTDFLREFLLEKSTQPWVIALDEIDTTIPLPFSDDFFAAIRRCHNARAGDPLFQRLTFLLAGVASPAQLIKDNRRTPFNIGYALSVTDFTADEAKVLLEGLGEPTEADHPALKRILYWTNGHPYLTQRIFLKLAEDIEDDDEPPENWEQQIDKAVKDTFLRPGARTREAHLEDIAKRRIGDLNKQGNPSYDPEMKRRMLEIYKRGWHGKEVKDDPVSKPCVELKLCGLLVNNVEEPSRLIVRNRIYRTVFDAAWIESETPKNNWKRLAFAAGGVTVAAIVFAVVAIRFLMYQQRQSTIADLSAQIERAETDIPLAAYTKLSEFAGQEERAKELLATYWARRARLVSVERPRDEATILWLKSLSTHELPEARLQVRRALSGAIPSIQGTFRHAGFVYHAAFSADRRKVVTASSDATARIWTVEGQPIGAPMVHADIVLRAEFSTDGRRIVTCSRDGTARTWDANTGLPVSDPMRQEGAVARAVFSPDGTLVVSVSRDSAARIWDAETGELLDRPMTHANPVRHASFSPDGTQIVTTSDDKSARIWNSSTGELITTLNGHSSGVTYASFSPDNQCVATASEDDTATIWDLKSGTQIGAPLQHSNDVNRVKFSPDGTRVVTASDDGTAQIWNAETGEPFGHRLIHEDVVYDAEYSADGRWVITSSRDNTARIWDAETCQPYGHPLQHDGPVYHGEFMLGEGQLVLTASADKTARVWNVDNNALISQSLKHQGHRTCAEFRSDGKRMAIGSSDDSVQIWNVETGKSTSRFAFPKVHATVFSPDGKRLIAAGEKTAQVRDSETGNTVGIPMIAETNFTSIDFSGDGQRVITASGNDVQVWNAETGEAIGQPLRHPTVVFHAGFGASDKRIITSSLDGARIWDSATGKELSWLKHEAAVSRATLNADGSLAATASENMVRVWKVDSSQIVATPIRYFATVHHVGFSGDGQRLITSTDNELTWLAAETNGKWTPRISVWSNGSSWKTSPLLKNSTGHQIRIADSWTGDVLVIRDLVIDEPDKALPGLDATADKLIEAYLKRFALAFEDEQKSPALRPAIPISGK
ncbi:MAG: AAA-like domain-containing protein [Planctomycetaceae bacterium]